MAPVWGKDQKVAELEAEAWDLGVEEGLEKAEVEGQLHYLL